MRYSCPLDKNEIFIEETPLGIDIYSRYYVKRVYRTRITISLPFCEAILDFKSIICVIVKKAFIRTFEIPFLPQWHFTRKIYINC